MTSLSRDQTTSGGTWAVCSAVASTLRIDRFYRPRVRPTSGRVPHRPMPGTSGWRQLADGVGEVEAGHRRDRDDGSVQTGRLVLGYALPALLGGSVDHQFVDQRVGDRLDSALAVAGVPGRQHGLDDVAAAEPLMEGGIYRHGEIGGNHPPADETGGAGVGGR